MGLVIDCSIAMTWFFEEEKTDASRQLLDALPQHFVLVPTIWHLEVGNTLAHAVRKGRVTMQRAKLAFAVLGSVGIQVDQETGQRSWSETFEIAHSHSLTVYDAAYLELAMRRRFVLCTLDRALQRAAGTCGVELHPL